MIPVREAVFAQVDPPPALVTRAMAAELERRGIPLAAISINEGYIESRWFDVETLAAVREPFGRRLDVVRLRLFADPIGRGTKLFLEAVYRVGWDPSVPERELERMVPEQHPVRPLLDSLVAGLRPPPGPGPPASPAP
jgi:hypothetical protein